MEPMLSEQRKLLISSYIDGESDPIDTVKVREMLANSKSARDYFQGQLHVARRVRQAICLDLPVAPIEPTEVLREILARPFPTSSPQSAFQSRPVWAVLALSFGLALWAGFGAWNQPKGESSKDQAKGGITLKSGLAARVEAPQKGPQVSQNPKAEIAAAKELESGSNFAEIANGVELVTLPEIPLENNDLQGFQEPAPIPSEILASPIGPSQSLKKIDLVLPSVHKAKLLEPTVLLDRELKGIVRLDLPTYQENEAVKRLVQTLKSEGCASFMDPVTEEKMKRNIPVGPVIIVIHGLDSGKICRAIQGTSRVLSKTPANQPTSVFDEVIVGNLGSKEGEAIAGMLISPAIRPSVSPSKSAEGENSKKSSIAGSNLGVFATISSASTLRIPGVVSPRKAPTKSPSDTARTPVVLNIVPLR